MSVTKLAGGTYDTTQLPDNIEHKVELNVPPAFPSLQDTVPVGVVGEFDVSVIFTVSGIDDPGCAVTRFGAIALDVGSGVTTFAVLLTCVRIELLLEFVPDGTVELVTGGETFALDDEVPDELPPSDVPLLEVSCETNTEVEFAVPGKIELEFPEEGPMEKAYCGKTSIAAIETKSKTLRSISLYLLNSANKELLHIVQEQC